MSQSERDWMHSKRALTRGDIDGAIPDYGVALGEDNILIGGNGSNSGFFTSGGTLYQLKLVD